MPAVIGRLLAGLGVLLITCGLLAGVVNREVLDGTRFADHVDDVRSDSAVSRALGIRISDQLIEVEPELVALRPLLESTASTLVASDAMGPVVRTAVTPLHDALVSGDQNQVLLRLADVGALVVAAITAVAPDQAANLPANLDVTLAQIGSGSFSAGFVEQAHLVRQLSWLLPLLGLLCMVVAGVLHARESTERPPRAWLRVLQHGLVWVAGLLLLLAFVGRFAVSFIDTSDLWGAVTAAAWVEFDAALVRATLWVAAGAVVVSVVRHPGFRIDSQSLPRLVGWLHADLPLRDRALRTALLIGCGLALVTQPLTVLSWVGVLAGAVLLLVAARDTVHVVAEWLYRTVPRLERVLRGQGPRVAIAMSVVLLGGVLVAGAWPTHQHLPLVSTGTGCNGHEELCERPYDQVTYATTHNAMSAADQPGWFLAEQPRGLVGQLDDGVRALMLDTWPGQQTGRAGVVANTEASRAEGLSEAEASFGRDVVGAARRLLGSLNLTPRGEVRTYLCHGLCELGSTDLVTALGGVRDWLDRNPREVVTLFLEDYVTPQVSAEAFRDAGLEPYALRHLPGDTWPTLGEMIDSGQRLVIINDEPVDATLPWILDGTVLTQDTPYSFTSASKFTCDRLRGPADAPLLTINHWLSNYATRIADADRVNATKVLLPRMEKCARERGQRVNYVAVDNYDRGDLFDVVDTLNGL